MTGLLWIHKAVFIRRIHKACKSALKKETKTIKMGVSEPLVFLTNDWFVQSWHMAVLLGIHKAAFIRRI